MREPALIRLLPDGRRMHLHDGPIDLILEANGGPHAVSAAYEAAARRFVSILDELCGELHLLRGAASKNSERPRGVVARRMFAAVEPYCEDCFITPMAAVAGSVAEEVLEAMTAAADLDRAYVNNGGDIAVHLGDRQSYKIGMVERPEHPSLFGCVEITSVDPVRGIATSGWRGRSFSLGIADAVTVLADCAAAADAAATVIANAVNLPDHSGVTRVPAREISPDSDLGERLVTRGVEPLSQLEIGTALDSGVRSATLLRERGLIHSAALCLQKRVRVLPSFSTKSERDGREGFSGPSAPELHAELELSGRTDPHA
ncbi:MAG TPA: UPF0280 family protein [Candidatus Baltobacteraceae bacterium]|jgi:ApbE superfamily uncharacterized protein (UPF0280 family)|nr:UPF0280 family protein [Candidatus Baltobacteraceae bacterium]